jgi:hypothetical protein
MINKVLLSHLINNNAYIDDYLERTAIKPYQVTFYRGINNLLRSDVKSLPKKYYNILNGLVYLIHSSKPVNKSFTLYRGVSIKINNFNRGDILSDKGFSSFSLIKNIADDFVNNEGTIIKLLVEPGQQFFFLTALEIEIENKSEVEIFKKKFNCSGLCEYELLSFPGMKLEVIGKNEINKEITVKLSGYEYGDNYKSIMDNFSFNDIDIKFENLLLKYDNSMFSFIYYFNNSRNQNEYKSGFIKLPNNFKDGCIEGSYFNMIIQLYNYFIGLDYKIMIVKNLLIPKEGFEYKVNIKEGSLTTKLTCDKRSLSLFIERYIKGEIDSNVFKSMVNFSKIYDNINDFDVDDFNL